jgi:CheY-like chemotaxis protein
MASPVQSVQPRNHPQILFVDDDAVLCKLCALLLTQHDYEVRTAADGLEALERLNESVPDLILSDLRMPRMSGFEFLSIVRRRFPSVPLIAMSGEFFAGTDPLLGIADEFLPKGAYSPEHLMHKVAELLAHPPQRQPELDSPPIWVPATPSGEVVLTCTNCLRSFAVRVCPPAMGNPMRETDCIACSTRLRYCIDHTTLPVGERAWENCGGLTKLASLNDEEVDDEL